MSGVAATQMEAGVTVPCSERPKGYLISLGSMNDSGQLVALHLSPLSLNAYDNY